MLTLCNSDDIIFWDVSKCLSQAVILWCTCWRSCSRFAWTQCRGNLAGPAETAIALNGLLHIGVRTLYARSIVREIKPEYVCALHRLILFQRRAIAFTSIYVNLGNRFLGGGNVGFAGGWGLQNPKQELRGWPRYRVQDLQKLNLSLHDPEARGLEALAAWCMCCFIPRLRESLPPLPSTSYKACCPLTNVSCKGCGQCIVKRGF